MSMQVRVVCPEHLAYEGPAAFVSIPTTDGALGIAPRHASEICTVKAGYLELCSERMGEVDCRIAVIGGFVEIADDKVVVLAVHARDMSTVDVEQVQADLQGFEDQLSVLSEDDARRAYLYNEVAWCKLLLGE